jgi:hypothetical protein
MLGQPIPNGCPDSKLKDQRCFDLTDRTGNAARVGVCSTEIINHGDCVIVLDRRYPVSLPTIQMHPGTQVYVVVNNPLDFETLSLDWTSSTALPGTDQLASFATAAVPQLKGFASWSVTSPDLTHFSGPEEKEGQTDAEKKAAQKERDDIAAIIAELKAMNVLLESAQNALPDESRNPTIYQNFRAIYGQLNQIMSPIPKPGSTGQKAYEPPADAQQTPNPWSDYSNWRRVVLCELVGVYAGKPCPIGATTNDPAFVNVLGQISTLQSQLPVTPPAAAPANPLFDQSTFEGLAKDAQAAISKLSVQSDKDTLTTMLKQLQANETSLLAQTSVLTTTLTNVQKDFVTYYQNVLIATRAAPTPKTFALDKTHTLTYSLLGSIDDPQYSRTKPTPILYARFLGRSTTFAVNAINNVATSETAITSTSSKTSLGAVTVLYADPSLETSAGAMVSFVHNRSFANQTITNATGTPYQPGDIVIVQTKTDPEVIPFVALHYRILPEFLWPDHRRGAIYGSIWVGLNAYSAVPEYGGGPTFSWRSLMFSFLYNRAHQTQLVSGQTVNEIVCSPTSMAGQSPPPCTPAPPAPVTHTVPLNAFAIGISVRLPTSFAAGTGGVSR